MNFSTFAKKKGWLGAQFWPLTGFFDHWQPPYLQRTSLSGCGDRIVLPRVTVNYIFWLNSSLCSLSRAIPHLHPCFYGNVGLLPVYLFVLIGGAVKTAYGWRRCALTFKKLWRSNNVNYKVSMWSFHCRLMEDQYLPPPPHINITTVPPHRRKFYWCL